MKIMVIEDDIELCMLIIEGLKKYNFCVFKVKDFKNIINEFEEHKPHLVLLDINLPYYDGFYICKSIRNLSNVPIIIISARNGELDQVLGMELGADDYILKPFNYKILLAKVNSSLRRVYGEYSEKSLSNTNITSLILDQMGFKISYNNNTLELSKNEYKLIHLFVINKDCVISREKILEELWDENLFIDDNTITVNVSRVKNRFRELGVHNAIKTKRGMGYILDSKVFD